MLKIIRALAGVRTLNTLPRNPGNFEPLTPLSWIDRAALVWDDSEAIREFLFFSLSLECHSVYLAGSLAWLNIFHFNIFCRAL